jgi:predicted NUDIX family phosphoesterase
MGKQVLAIPTELLFSRIERRDAFTGFDEYPLTCSQLFAGAEFIDREQAEHDPSYKQIIPYGVIRGLRGILCYQRGDGSDESRLVAKHSFGFGGHVEPSDGKNLLMCMIRELSEELLFGDIPFCISPAGIVNEDFTEVGTVHVGMVYSIVVHEAVLVSGETDIANLRWEAAEQMEEKKELGLWEGWSKLLMDGGLHV